MASQALRQKSRSGNPRKPAPTEPAFGKLISGEKQGSAPTGGIRLLPGKPNDKLCELLYREIWSVYLV